MKKLLCMFLLLLSSCTKNMNIHKNIEANHNVCQRAKAFAQGQRLKIAKYDKEFGEGSYKGMGYMVNSACFVK